MSRAPDSGRLTIYLMNNYSMRKALRQFEAGTYPGQHLWGVIPKSSAIEWVVPKGLFDLRVLSRRGLVRLRTLILRSIGDPFQQIAILSRTGRRANVIYAADQWSGALIGALARVGVVRRPYLVLVHHAPKSRWNRFCLRGASSALVLSAEVGRELQAHTFRSRSIEIALAPWGPDLDWAGYQSPRTIPKALQFVSAGRTNRDHDALRAAVQEHRLSGVIFDGEAREDYVDGRLESSRPGSADYPEIVEAITRSSSVVIPLADPHVLSGLTEIADAAALGVPVIVTRSSLLPYDITGLSAGVVLERNSADEIGRAVLAASSSRATSPALGERYNTVRFQEVLTSLATRAVADS
jgi:glycosyltransferase involved in cell wall biosynthesis